MVASGRAAVSGYARGNDGPAGAQNGCFVDIDADKVDCVVAYKEDRLSRSDYGVVLQARRELRVRDASVRCHELDQQADLGYAVARLKHGNRTGVGGRQRH